jgi:hypothetical protein
MTWWGVGFVEVTVYDVFSQNGLFCPFWSKHVGRESRKDYGARVSLDLRFYRFPWYFVGNP